LGLQDLALLEEGAILTNEDPVAGFEVEATTVEEFLRLLKKREGGEASVRQDPGALRRAVFVARMLYRRDSRFGYPSVTRYVVAAFAYGRDVVCCRRATSHAVELPELARMTEERQRAAYDELRAEIERGLEELGLRVPVREGLLRRAAGNGRVRRDEGG
jgi:hypothetical protein